MTTTTAAPDAVIHALPRAMGLRDLVLFNIVAILSLRWFATAAAAGPSSVSFWILALRGTESRAPLGTRVKAAAIGLAGLSLTVFAMVIATVPPAGTEEPWLFRLKVIGGAGAFVLLGGAVYLRGRR